ncbi:hypothetical protein [Sphingomonas sp. Root710]|uniref:hypothetical protein n=1 Tax=Sphingomonas sp. Root710 TaxID=1736594 RepID=UPI000B027CC1|nr:hypothetical protein [Sphingomonas sp. Root710]
MIAPLRNRVTPFGEIVATPHRGSLMGNRGCLHDDEGNIVRYEHPERSAWISCVLAWPGVRRQLMQPECYTELFFLDEATALAAGHRPCGECRPEQLQAFKEAWARAYGLRRLPRVQAIDAELRATPPLAHRSPLRDAGRQCARWRHGVPPRFEQCLAALEGRLVLLVLRRI